MNYAEILVTGGTGILGSKVVERLRSAGIEPCVLSHRGRPGTIVGDLLTGEGLEEAVSGVDTIVHCASSSFRKARDTGAGRSSSRTKLQYRPGMTETPSGLRKTPGRPCRRTPGRTWRRPQDRDDESPAGPVRRSRR